MRGPTVKGVTDVWVTGTVLYAGARRRDWSGSSRTDQGVFGVDRVDCNNVGGTCKICSSTDSSRPSGRRPRKRRSRGRFSVGALLGLQPAVVGHHAGVVGPACSRSVSASVTTSRERIALSRFALFEMVGHQATWGGIRHQGRTRIDGVLDAYRAGPMTAIRHLFAPIQHLLHGRFCGGKLDLHHSGALRRETVPGGARRFPPPGQGRRP